MDRKTLADRFDIGQDRISSQGRRTLAPFTRSAGGVEAKIILGLTATAPASIRC